MIGDAQLIAAADVVEPFPESLGHGILAGVRCQPRRIPDRDPFEHAVERIVEDDRVEDLPDSRMRDPGLAQRNPALQAALRDDGFGLGLAHCVLVEPADLDRIAGAAPVHRRIAVPGLRDRSDIDQRRCLSLSGRLDRFNDVARAADVHLHRQFGKAVGKGRHHAADVQHQIHTLDASTHVLRACQIAD